MKISISPNDSTTYQRSHSQTDYCGISVYIFNGSLFESNNTFLYDLWQYAIFTLGQFPVNIQSRTNIMYINRFNTQTLFFPLYGIRIPTQHSKLNCIHRNTITEFIPRHYNDRVTSKILTYIFFSFFFFFGEGGGGVLIKIHYTGNLVYHPPLVFRILFLITCPYEQIVLVFNQFLNSRPSL